MRSAPMPSLEESIAFHLLVDGVYEPGTADFLSAHLKRGGTLADVGANIGVFAVPAARRVGPAGHAIAIEASPRIIPYLRKNIGLNGCPNVRVLPFAAYE